ncbi:MAG: glycosyltransferase family 39 protein [Candidatus Levyibacteriota bacterium]
MKKTALIFGFLFFIAGLYVLPHYNPNWDEATHFYRGQAYLHYFLTGNKDYRDLPQVSKYSQKDDTLFFSPVNKERSEIYRRSIYMDNGINFKFFMEKDGGHPPLSDIFASFFNLVLFQKLGFISDVESYHVYSLFLAAILVGVIFWWTSKYWGFFAGLVAFLSLSLHPIFLGEAHNNIKDIPETVFYSLTIIAFYEGLTRRSIKWMIASSVFFGFAWGTKFNAVFLPFIILPWTLIYLYSFRQKLKKFTFLIPSLFLYIAVASSIFVASWPFLWPSPIEKFMDVVGYYKGIGIDTGFDPRFLTIFRINTYAVQLVLYTTPLVMLFFSSLGIFYIFTKGIKEKQKFSLLVLLWFLFPILRVSIPNAGIYGGVRQIMEYIPAMAILCGIGASYMVTVLHSYIVRKSKLFSHLAIKPLFLLQFVIILTFLPITFKLISIHPNEDVYFNPIIGGLKGARDKSLPGWGDSMGNPYRQAVRWINANAEKNAKVAINFGSGANIPETLFREDIAHSNLYRSAMQRKGEYIIGLTHNSGYEDEYFLQYLNNFLIPVYQVDVDGVSILKIWKNDTEHTREEYKDTFLLQENPSHHLEENTLAIELDKNYYMTEMRLRFSGECAKEKEGSIEVSEDNLSWDVLDYSLSDQGVLLYFPTYQKNNEYIYYFANKNIKYIRINFYDENSCFKIVENIKIYGFK